MAIPIFLQTKTALIYNESGNIMFQADGRYRIVYYRVKSIVTGKILSTGTCNVTAREARGANYVHTFDLVFSAPFQDSAGNTDMVNLSISLDNRTWSPSMRLSLIQKPTLTIAAYQEVNVNKKHVTGTLSFASLQETDSLDLYRIRSGNSLDIPQLDSGWLNPTSFNMFDFTLPQTFASVAEYTFTIEYRTNKGYSNTIQNQTLSFIDIPDYSIAEGELPQVEFITTGENNSIEGDVVTIKKWGIEGYLDSLRDASVYLERSTSLSNYTEWERVQQYPLNCTEDNFKIKIYFEAYDRYLNYGVGYKYRMRLIFKNVLDNSKYQLVTTGAIEDDNIFYCMRDDLRLEAPNGSYLTVRFNPTITSYKYNIKEAVTPTIGGVYPVVRRNGDQRYRTFTIGGLISSEGEENSNPIIDTNEASYLSDYNAQMIIKERLFREKVLEFLLQDEIRLLRSPTEGMILIRLSNIALTPNQQLGRRLWSFTAQATEVADCSSNTLSEYQFSIKPMESNTMALGDLVITKYTGYDEATATMSVESDGVQEELVSATEVEPVLIAEFQWAPIDNS